MSKARTHRALISVAWGVACLAVPGVLPAATPVKLAGAITGTVRNSMGVPQMGATVLLSNRQERTIDRALTDTNGNFRFAGLIPDLYGVKVFTAALIPAIKKDILVQPGMQSVLAVRLNSLISTIQLSYPPLENGSLMTDDWKWALRTSSATRAVQRFLDAPLVADPRSSAHLTAFSDTRGILRLSGGGSLDTGTAYEADMGTAFALATSLYGSNNFQLSGNVGYGSQTGVPTAAIRTSYSRSMMGGNPEVSLTMRQLFLPGRLANALSNSESSLPLLRTMSVGFDDHAQVSDNVTLHYGFTMESVAFLDHLNYLSPYARLSWSLGDGAELDLTYTSGNARPDLAAPRSEDLQQGLNSLGQFPLMSLRAGKPQVQRGTEYEIAYSRKVGSRVYTASAYRESVTNAALTLVAPAGLYDAADVLPDIFSDSSIFNAGDFNSSGVSAAVTQNLGDHFAATLVYGTFGVLTAGAGDVTTNSPDELRAMIHAGRREAATTRITGTVPHAGTRFTASYQWNPDHRWAIPGNTYSTQSFHPMPGFNVSIRQPLPGFGGRVEATADLRNMLAQGYLPVGMVAGQRVMLVQSPRTLRGGLAFIF